MINYQFHKTTQSFLELRIFVKLVFRNKFDVYSENNIGELGWVQGHFTPENCIRNIENYFLAFKSNFKIDLYF